MGRLLIMIPATVASSSLQVGAAGYERVLTPNPKEAYVANSGSSYFDLDLGVPVAIDTIFVGYITDGTQATFRLEAIPGIGQTATDAIIDFFGAAIGHGNPRHALGRRSTLFTSRYVRVVIQSPNAPVTIGTIALGGTFSSTYSQEWGGGQFVEDTGTAERMKGGGFAIDPGVATTGWQWTLGDLTNPERRQLMQIVKDRRTTKTLLVVENDDRVDGLNELIHWGLLRKLEPYERLDPLNTKWGFQIQDWA